MNQVNISSVRMLYRVANDMLSKGMSNFDIEKQINAAWGNPNYRIILINGRIKVKNNTSKQIELIKSDVLKTSPLRLAI